MADIKDQVAAGILKARESLEQALSDLQRIPALDPSAVPFAAHALNNYLTVSEGTIALLRSALTAHPDPQVRAWLDALNHATTLMTHTVSRLTNAAVPRESSLRFEPVDLPALVQRVHRYYQRIADTKSLHLHYTCGADVPQVRTDRVATAAVLDNLLSNAVKYSAAGRRIWIEVEGDDSSASCSVRDEGPGLSPEEQARLFQRGVRLSPRPTGGEPSTGYGLAVARELIEQLGGTIGCVSTQGRGSCFSFRLPAYEGSGADPRQGRPVPASRR
jgi:signal transduction histidine kinase